MVLLPQKKTQKKLRDTLNQLYVHLDSAGGSGDVSWSIIKFDWIFLILFFIAWNARWTWIWSIWILSLCLLQNQHWHGWQPIRRTVMPTLTILFCLFCDDLWWLLSLLVINQRKGKIQIRQIYSFFQIIAWIFCCNLELKDGFSESWTPQVDQRSFNNYLALCLLPDLIAAWMSTYLIQNINLSPTSRWQSWNPNWPMVAFMKVINQKKKDSKSSIRLFIFKHQNYPFHCIKLDIGHFFE